MFKAQWKCPKCSTPIKWEDGFIQLDHLLFSPFNFPYKAYNDFLRNEARTCCSSQILIQIWDGKMLHNIKVVVQISIVKPRHAK